MQLSVIIVNYNVKYFLEHCLLSVMKACAPLQAEILVVDNNSSDGSREYLQPKFPSVTFHWNKENLGFGKANNSVLAAAKGKYILFLNPDTIVPEDCFTKCIAFFEKQPDCGALGVRMIDGSGQFLKESKRSLPTPAAGFYKMSGLTKLFPASPAFAQYYAAHLPEHAVNVTEVLAGAFMMLSKKAIDLTGGFDEAFFMYGEDVDLSYRISKAGLKNYYFPETTIIHFKGESTQKRSAAYIEHFYGAMKRFVDKHYSKNFLKHRLMLFAISVKQKAEKISKIKDTPVRPSLKDLKLVLAGDPQAVAAAEKILAASQLSYTIEQRLNTTDAPSLKKGDAVVFCEGALSNKAIIDALQLLAGSCDALFYESGARSIIGSNDKNEKGIFIAAG